MVPFRVRHIYVHFGCDAHQLLCPLLPVELLWQMASVGEPHMRDVTTSVRNVFIEHRPCRWIQHIVPGHDKRPVNSDTSNGWHLIKTCDAFVFDPLCTSGSHLVFSVLYDMLMYCVVPPTFNSFAPRMCYIITSFMFATFRAVFLWRFGGNVSWLSSAWS